jgi:WD40 repeat protein
MPRRSLFLSAALAVLTVTAHAQQPPPAKDIHGDALPDGAVARLGTMRWRHGGVTTFAAFLPDGKTVLSAAMDKTIRIWEYPTGKELRRIGEPAVDNNAMMGGFQPVGWGAFGSAAVALSRDGKTVAALFDRNAVRLYEVATGKELPALKLPGGNGAAAGLNSPSSVALAPDNQHLAVLDLDGTVHIWDWVQGKELRNFAGPAGNNVFFGGMAVLVYSPDGKMLATVKHELVNNNMVVQMVKLWDPATGKELLNLTGNGQGGVYSPAFSPDSKTLALSNVDGTISLVDPGTGKEIRSWKQVARGVPMLIFSPDGSKLYSRSTADQAVLEWDVSNGKELRKFTPALPAATAGRAVGAAQLAIAPDGKTLVLAGLNNGLTFVDLTDGKEAAAPNAPASALADIHYNPDGKHLFTRGVDGTLFQWEAGTGKPVGPVKLPQNTYRALLSPDGQWLATVSFGPQGSKILEAATGKEVGQVPTKQNDLNATLAFAPDGKTLAVRLMQDRQILLCEVPSGKVLRTIGIETGINANPGGGFGGPVRLAPALMFFSADGKTLAAFADPNNLGLFDTATGQRVGSVLPEDAATVHSGAFAPDGRSLALDLNDGTVGLYEIATGQLRRHYGTKMPPPKMPGGPGGVVIINGGTSAVNGQLGGTRVVFSRDGQSLIHAGLDQVVHVWDITTAKELAAFKGHTGALQGLALAPDGKRVASASTDTTALVWDLGRAARPATVVKPLAQGEADAQWKNLLAKSTAAFDAICALAASPKEAVALLKEQLKPAAPLDMKRVETLVANLDNNQYKVRQQAYVELQKLDERLIPALDKALTGSPPLETRKRLEDLRKQLASVNLAGERLRAYRAVEVLERIGTTEARQALETLAAGAPGATLTTAAQAALRRLKVD